MSLSKQNLVTGIMARCTFTRVLQRGIFMLCFHTSCSVAKKGTFNRYHVLRKYNAHRNSAIITDVTVINITSRIKKKKKKKITVLKLFGKFQGNI